MSEKTEVRTERITTRITAAHKARILSIAKSLGNEGSISVGLRWLIEAAPSVEEMRKRGRKRNVSSKQQVGV